MRFIFNNILIFLILNYTLGGEYFLLQKDNTKRSLNNTGNINEAEISDKFTPTIKDTTNRPENDSNLANFKPTSKTNYLQCKSYLDSVRCMDGPINPDSGIKSHISDTKSILFFRKRFPTNVHNGNSNNSSNLTILGQIPPQISRKNEKFSEKEPSKQSTKSAIKPQITNKKLKIDSKRPMNLSVIEIKQLSAIIPEFLEYTNEDMLKLIKFPKLSIKNLPQLPEFLKSPEIIKQHLLPKFPEFPGKYSQIISDMIQHPEAYTKIFPYRQHLINM